MERVLASLGAALAAVCVIALGVAWWQRSKRQIARNRRRHHAADSSRLAAEAAASPQSPPAVAPALPGEQAAADEGTSADAGTGARTADCASPTGDRAQRIAELEGLLQRLAESSAAARPAAVTGTGADGWPETQMQSGPGVPVDFAATQPVEFGACDRASGWPQTQLQTDPRESIDFAETLPVEFGARPLR